MRTISRRRKVAVSVITGMNFLSMYKNINLETLKNKGNAIQTDKI